MRSQRSGYLVMTPMSTVAVGRSQAASEKTYRANQISLRRFSLGQPFGVNPVGLTRKIPLTWEPGARVPQVRRAEGSLRAPLWRSGRTEQRQAMR